MKKISLLIAIFVCALTLNAQTENNSSTERSDDDEIKTLFNGDKNGKQSNGGYGGIMINYGQIDSRDALLVGAKGAWIINHSLGIGLAGYGMMTGSMLDNIANQNLPYQNKPIDLQYEYGGGYGGLLLEPIILGKSPVHLSIPIIVGAGGLAYFTQNGDYSHYDNYYFEDADVFFVVEPGIELEFNIVKHFRMALTASYRYTSDIDLTYDTYSSTPGTQVVNPDILRGFNFGMAFKFGKF